MTWRADYYRERRTRLREAGQCIDCAKKHTAKTRRCLDCRQKYGARANAKRAAQNER